MTFDERIAELEAERESITEACRANSEQRQQLKDEYDALINRRLEAQKEINSILREQVALQQSRPTGKRREK